MKSVANTAPWCRWRAAALWLVMLCMLAVVMHQDSAAAAAQEQASSGSLSVAPGDELRYPEQRPAWIDEGPRLGGPLHRWPVNSSPSSTVELASQSLEVQLRAVAEMYVETLLDSPDAPAVVSLHDDWISARLSPDHQYEGEVYRGEEVLYEAAAELQFDEQSRREIQGRWDAHQVQRRIVGLGAMTLGGTMLLLMTSAGLSILTRRAERRVEHPARA